MNLSFNLHRYIGIYVGPTWGEAFKWVVTGAIEKLRERSQLSF